jgi:hypothetical protein
LSPPAGDIASEPALAFAGNPTLGPGSFEITTDASTPPPPLAGRATTEPASSGAPSPAPLAPRPEPTPPFPFAKVGGRGTTLGVSAGPEEADSGLSRVGPAPGTAGGGGTTLEAATGAATGERALDIPTDGGGGTTFLADATGLAPARAPVEVAELPETAGGGGRTLDPTEPAVRDGLLPVTVGGGATTDELPKTRFSRELMYEVLAAGVGGGGTTLFERSGALPLANRCRSCDISADGGGATTDATGIASLGFRAFSRSGAETGGGTTMAFAICTGERETSRLTAAGAGGTMLELRAGAERASRAASRERLGAGAMTRVSSEGATNIIPRSREASGAGAITLVARAGVERVRSLERAGAGATTLVFKVGAMSTRSRETLGAGGMTDPGARAVRERSLVTLGTGAITLDGRFGTAREDRMPSVGGGPASGRIASRFATAPAEGASLSRGASRTFSTMEPPRATLMVCVR